MNEKKNETHAPHQYTDVHKNHREYTAVTASVAIYRLRTGCCDNNNTATTTTTTAVVAAAATPAYAQ